MPTPSHTQTGTVQCQEETPYTDRRPLTRVSIQPPQLFGHCLGPALVLPSSKTGRPRHLEMDRNQDEGHRSPVGVSDCSSRGPALQGTRQPSPWSTSAAPVDAEGPLQISPLRAPWVFALVDFSCLSPFLPSPPAGAPCQPVLPEGPLALDPGIHSAAASQPRLGSSVCMHSARPGSLQPTLTITRVPVANPYSRTGVHQEPGPQGCS